MSAGSHQPLRDQKHRAVEKPTQGGRERGVVWPIHFSLLCPQRPALMDHISRPPCLLLQLCYANGRLQQDTGPQEESDAGGPFSRLPLIASLGAKTLREPDIVLSSVSAGPAPSFAASELRGNRSPVLSAQCCPISSGFPETLPTVMHIPL